MPQLDKLTEKFVRGLAGHTSRRSLLSILGSLLTGAAALPLLPVARAAAADQASPSDPNSGEMPPQSTGNPQDPGDPTKCDYWRYCAIDGSLCSCYGGTMNSCPPGTEMSPITWIGTCRNPADKRSYIISYNDCCGGVPWGRCACQNNLGDRPVVRPQNNNEVTWCFGTQSQSYTCSTAIILGVALDQNERSKRQSGLPRLRGAAATRTAAALLAVACGCAALLIGASRADESSGASIFATRCAVCHGPQAAGIPGTFPSLHEQVVAFAKTEQGRDYLIMVLTSGLMGELKVGGVRYNNVMPAQSGLSEADVAGVLSYLASGLGKNEEGAAAVSTSDVKEARARHAQNSAPSTRTLRPTYEP